MVVVVRKVYLCDSMAEVTGSSRLVESGGVIRQCLVTVDGGTRKFYELASASST